MQVVVTGGAGFIGSHLARKLISLGHHVTIIDDLSTGRIANIPEGASFVEADITEIKPVTEALINANIVYHLAAISSVALCNSQPELAKKVNDFGTIVTLTQSILSGVRQFILASSASVYGNLGNIALREDMPTNPESVYATTKLAAEQYCQKMAREYSCINILIPRFFNVIGDGQTLDGDWIIPNFFDRIAAGQSLRIYGDGEDKRDYIFVDDVVDALIHLANSHQMGIYNIGTGTATSVNEIAGAFSKLYDKPLNVEHIPARKGDIPYSCADITKLIAAGYSPKDTFIGSLRKIKDKKGV